MRESPDTTAKAEGKSLKISGESTYSQSAIPRQGAQVDNTSVDCDAEKDESTKQHTATRCIANNAPEARLQTRAHTAVYQHKLSKCVQALNAQPIDLMRIAEVTEIQLASNDLVVIAAKYLGELSEASSEEAAPGQSGGDAAASNLHQVQLRARHKVLSRNPQTMSSLTRSSNQKGENESPGTTCEEKQGDTSQSKDTSDQRATAQDSTQQSSSNAATDQRATAQGEVQTSSTSGATQGAEKSTTSAAASADSARKKTD